MNNVITIGGRYPDFNEIVADLEIRLPLAEKKKIAARMKNELPILHHGLGTWIRNSYGLWSVSPTTEKWRTDPTSHVIINGVDHSPDHPDAMSMSIIEELWNRVQHLK